MLKRIQAKHILLVTSSIVKAAPRVFTIYNDICGIFLNFLRILFPKIDIFTQNICNISCFGSNIQFCY